LGAEGANAAENKGGFFFDPDVSGDFLNGCVFTAEG
jgi:hypothetical protein